MAKRGIHSSAYIGSSPDPVEKPPCVEPDVEKAYAALSEDYKLRFSWQHYGYPALSKWMASANDFCVLRRFSPLQARCLLYLQNEIATYDQELQRWDGYAQRQINPGDGNSSRINGDPSTLPDHPRPRLIRDVIPILQQYNDLVHSFSQLKAKETAQDHHIRNIENWFLNHGPTAIRSNEQHFRNNFGDLFTLLSKPRYPLVSFLHNSKFIRRIFTLKARPDRIDEPLTFYTSDRGLETFATLIALSVGLGMTFGSVWWLNVVESNVYRLAIITCSGTLITVLTWLAAGNRPFEILAAFAAYMAVLMIYRQISD